MDWGTLRATLVTHHSTRFAEIERETSEHLRLAPAMHGDIVPSHV